MSIVRVITPPAFEPVSVTQFQAHARIDLDDDYTYAAGLITAARQHLENIAWRTFMPSVLEVSLTCWPGQVLELERAPLIGISSIKYTPEGGAETTLSAGVYTVDNSTEPGRVLLKRGQTWPSTVLELGAPIRVRYTAGYGTALLTESSSAVDVAAARAAVPAGIRLAIMLLAAHYYENREAVVAGGGVSVAVVMPMAVDALMQDYRLNAW